MNIYLEIIVCHVVQLNYSVRTQIIILAQIQKLGIIQNTCSPRPATHFPFIVIPDSIPITSATPHYKNITISYNYGIKQRVRIFHSRFKD